MLGLAGSILGLAGNVAAWKNLACFAAGTPILTPEGSTPIEDLRVGDWVLSKPEDDPEGVPVPRRVVELIRNYVPLLNLKVGGRVVRTSAEHPFWVRGRGWTDAHQLMAGDHLLSHEGRWLALEGTEDAGEAAPVYNVQIDEYHTYFVGGKYWGFSVWAHNAKCHLNFNDAVSEFGIYEITVNGVLHKIGKADLNRVTLSSELPTRLHAQLRKLRRIHGEDAVKGGIVQELGETTTREAKLAETGRLQEFFDRTGIVPEGNRKSFFPL